MEWVFVTLESFKLQLQQDLGVTQEIFMYTCVNKQGVKRNLMAAERVACVSRLGGRKTLIFKKKRCCLKSGMFRGSDLISAKSLFRGVFIVES